MIALLILSTLCVGGTNELDVARQALRDGLYSIARQHAANDDGEAARLVVLESFAREQKWTDVLSQIDAMGYPKGDGFGYYRALALYKTGSVGQSSNILSHVSMERGPFAHSAARLGAEIASSAGDDKSALELLDRYGGKEVDTKMMIAAITPDRKRALALWREVATDDKADDSVRAAAAANLDDVELLRSRLAVTKAADSVAMLSARLGMSLIATDDGFAEGEKLILSAAQGGPDAFGVRTAFCRLADEYLRRCDYAKSAKTFVEALKVWPEASKDETLHSGLGMAYAKLNRPKDAQDEFARAESLAEDDESRALEALRLADALVVLGNQKEATEAYQRVCAKYPNTKAASMVDGVIARREMESRGRQAYGEFRFDDAAKIFSGIAKDYPSEANRMDLYLALCEYGAGREDEAERRMVAIDRKPGISDEKLHATRWLARFAFNCGRWREARKKFIEYADSASSAADVPEALAWAARSALADNDFDDVIAIAARVRQQHPTSPWCASAIIAQGEALIELGRFEDAILALDGVSLIDGVDDEVRTEAKVLQADALFAVGADNSAQYAAALDAYSSIRNGVGLSPDDELTLSYKIAKTLEKLHRSDEALDMYYTKVVLAYRTGRIAGVRYGDSARAVFASSAIRLADEYERSGRIQQAMHVLDLVRMSDVPAAGEAAKRIDRLMQKGR